MESYHQDIAKISNFLQSDRWCGRSSDGKAECLVCYHYQDKYFSVDLPARPTAPSLVARQDHYTAQDIYLQRT